MVLLGIHTVSRILHFSAHIQSVSLDCPCGPPICTDSWNDWLYQWIGYANWQYSRTFDVTSDQIEGKTVWLKCDGLDTVANIR